MTVERHGVRDNDDKVDEEIEDMEPRLTPVRLSEEDGLMSEA